MTGREAVAHRQLPALVASAAVVAALVATALLATGTASPAVAFQQTGHWVFNRSEGVAAHVDGGTHQVDARVAVPGAGDPVLTLQGDKQGFVVGRQSITVFGRSSLTVEGTMPAGGPEVPYGIEVLGGPYLVYRQSGVVVRLGERTATVRVGGAVDRPTYTDDGTVWVHRPDTGAVCALRRGAESLDCTRGTAAGLPGALAVATRSAAFLDTADDAAQVVDDTAPASVAPLGVDLPDTALIGDRDTRNRLPAVVPGANRLVLVDSAGVPSGGPAGSPVAVELGQGDFSEPMASDGVVAVVEQLHHRLLVFGVDGRPLGAADLPADGSATLTRGGDGRIYVDDADGSATHVVGADGSVTSVATGGVNRAVGAPAPDLLRPAPPSRPSAVQGPPAVGGGGQSPPVPGPSGDPIPPPDPGPVPLPLPPLPPTAVTAKAGAGSAVTVAWRPGNDADGVTYSVRPIEGGGAQTTTRATASFTALAAGTTYTFAVTAANGAGTSAESAPSNAVTVLAGIPGAPTGLTVTKDYFEGNTGLTKDIAVAWTAPPLGGGELVKYVVREYDRNGKTDSLLVKETTETTARIVNGYACLAPFRVEVRAVTRTPGTPKEITGPAASVTTTTLTDCTMTMSITAQAAGAGSATVTLTKASGRAYVSWPCDLQFDGVTKWSGNCGGSAGPTTVTVDGLDPSTTYSVVASIQQLTTTTSNTATLTTPAA